MSTSAQSACIVLKQCCYSTSAHPGSRGCPKARHSTLVHHQHHKVDQRNVLVVFTVASKTDASVSSPSRYLPSVAVPLQSNFGTNGPLLHSTKSTALIIRYSKIVTDKSCGTAMRENKRVSITPDAQCITQSGFDEVRRHVRLSKVSKLNNLYRRTCTFYVHLIIV